VNTDLSLPAARRALLWLACASGLLAALRLPSHPRGMLLLVAVAIAAGLAGLAVHVRILRVRGLSRLGSTSR
jgi:hypothetical protein